jgi:hypothetical protein
VPPPDPASAHLPASILLQQVEAHGTAQPPGPGREMTFEEKRKLSHSMGSLAGERLVHVLQIIAEGPSAPVLVGAGRETGLGRNAALCRAV